MHVKRIYKNLTVLKHDLTRSTLSEAKNSKDMLIEVCISCGKLHLIYVYVYIQV